MKTIRIYFEGFWDDFDMYNDIVWNILKKHYNIVIDKESPDYIFCSIFGKPFEYCNYDGIRIFCSGENYTPDFNVVDYAIGYDNLIYGDRYFRQIYIPMKYDSSRYNSLIEQLTEKYKKIDEGILKKKDGFCNLIYGHDRDDLGRARILEILSTYKRVDSAGAYLNNMPDSMAVTRAEKLEFQSRYKFTVAFESVDMRGFFTEKIVDAFLADSIPIYLGDPDIKEIFNEKAFINVNDFESFDAVLEKIEEIDNNDDLFMEMLRQPIFVNEELAKGHDERFEKFLLHIFEQDKEKAYRRGRGPAQGVVVRHEKRLLNYEMLETKANKNTLLVRMIERIKTIARVIKHHL